MVRDMEMILNCKCCKPLGNDRRHEKQPELKKCL